MVQEKKSMFSKRVWNIFKIVLAVVLIGFVFSKTNFSEVAGMMKQLSPLWLGVSFVLFCMLTLIKAFQYYLLTGGQAPYARVLYVVVTQNAISNFIAGGAGIASYMTMLSVDEGVRFRKVLSAFLIAKVGDLISVWIILLASSVLLWNQIGAVQYAVVVLLIGIFGAVIVFGAAALFHQKFISLVKTILLWMKLDRFALVQRGMDSLQLVAEQEAQSVLRTMLTGLFYSLVYMVVSLFWFYANIRAYSLDFPLSVITFVNAFIQLISWIPIQVFGGLGVSETSLVYLFGLFGLPTAQIAAMGIGFRVILYAFTLVALLYLPLSSLFKHTPQKSQG